MKIFGLEISRATVTPPVPLQDAHWFTEMFTMKSSSGITVTPDNAMTASAVFTSIRVLSETVAGMPLTIYKKTSKGRTEAVEHPLYSLLHIAPNGSQTSFAWKETMMAHLNLRGNYYNYKIFNGRGDVIELLPLNPDKMTLMRADNGDILYHYQDDANQLNYMFERFEIVHQSGLSLDGVIGVSPIAYARNAIGLSLATETHGALAFENGTTPSGTLEHPGKLTDDQYKRLKKSMADNQSGLANSHKTMILEEGMKWAQIGMTNTDAQYLETRKFQKSEIAGIFRVPPHMIGDLERSTFSNIEQQSLEFAKYSIRPWVTRIEQALERDLLSKEDRKTHFIRFNMEALLRGDTKSRYESYGLAIRDGWMSRNETRAKEDMQPIDGLDEMVLPLNMASQNGDSNEV